MSDELIRFFEIAARLKTLDRAGWRRCGVDPCESVAEHTFGVALLALLTPADGVNRDHCVALALVHDLAESIVGDLTPHDPIGPDEKHRRESNAIKHLSETLGGERILQLWEEFEAAQTPEAKLVRDLDVIEMAAQARRYQRAGTLDGEAAAGFIDSARRRVTTDAGRRLLDSVLRAG